MFSGQFFGLEVLSWMATIFVFVVGLLILFLIGVYITDISQIKQAIRRNYPVIGHFRYYFEHIDTFFSPVLLHHVQRRNAITMVNSLC